jgi:hypothetical protein
MKMITIGCLLGFFIVLSSCGQSYLPEDLFTYPSDSGPVPEYIFEPDVLAGSPSYSARLTPSQPFTNPVEDTTGIS